MTPATLAAAARVLKLREAVDRAALLAAARAQADREAAATDLADAIAREHVFAAQPLQRADPVATGQYGAWGRAAAASLGKAHAAAAAAAEACIAPRAALAETLRLRRGLDLLAEDQQREHDRAVARRDSLSLLMVLPTAPTG